MFLFFGLAIHQILRFVDFGSEVRRSTCDKKKIFITKYAFIRSGLHEVTDKKGHLKSIMSVWFTAVFQNVLVSMWSLTSVWMVEDHQFSVSFSDLIPVGCGAERDTKIMTIRATESKSKTQGAKISN